MQKGRVNGPNLLYLNCAIRGDVCSLSAYFRRSKTLKSTHSHLPTFLPCDHGQCCTITINSVLHCIQTICCSAPILRHAV